jgi:excisionase family DNA binding protein
MAESLVDCLKGIVREVIREELERVMANNGEPAPLEVDGKEAARLLNLPLSWVMSAARKGTLKSIKHGHHVRFSMTDLNDFIQRRNGGSNVVSD